MPAVSVASLALALFLSLPAAEARVTKITAEPPVVIDLPLFGATGAYLKITGSFEGELDPADRRNAVITDIDLAPKVGGKVRYKSTFAILRPQSLAAGNHEILYDFGNRGQKHIIEWFNDATPADDPKEAKDFGNGWLMRQGFDVVCSGWDGQAPRTRTARRSPARCWPSSFQRPPTRPRSTCPMRRRGRRPTMAG
jgi:hypothetical protein